MFFCFLRHRFFIFECTLALTILLFIYKKQKYGKTHVNEEENQQLIANTLFSSVKILCLINSSKKEIFNRAIHINATWAQRCNKHIFLTYKKNINISLPMIDLKIPEVRTRLWDKWRAALRWVYDNELENYDYFLRADDDSYFIMENLRFMLLPYDPKKALIFGCRLNSSGPEGYMAGGSGVILTREALRQIVPAADNAKVCPELLTWNQQGIDDVELGACAEKLKIPNVDTRDKNGQHRMLLWSPTAHFTYGLNPEQSGIFFYAYQNDRSSCCSKRIVSFHYMYKEQLYAYEFLIYRTKVVKFSIDSNNEDMREPHNLIRKLKQDAISFTFNKTFIE